MEMGYAADLHREALIATGVVLFVFILLINLCFSLLKRRDGQVKTVTSVCHKTASHRRVRAYLRHPSA